MHACSLVSVNTRVIFSGLVRKPYRSINLGEIWGLQVTVEDWSVCGLYTKIVLYQPHAVGIAEGVAFLFIRGDMSSGTVA